MREAVLVAKRSETKQKEIYDTEVTRIAAMEEELNRLVLAKQDIQEAVDLAEEERKNSIEGLTTVATEKTSEMLHLNDMKDEAVELVLAMLDALEMPIADKEDLVADYLMSKGVEVSAPWERVLTKVTTLITTAMVVMLMTIVITTKWQS